MTNPEVERAHGAARNRGDELITVVDVDALQRIREIEASSCCAAQDSAVAGRRPI